MKPNFEQPPAESAFSRERVLEVMARFVEGGTVLKEFSDANRLYLLELSIPGKEEGETKVFAFQREGTFPNGVASAATVINMIDLDANGEVDWSENVAELNSATGEWEAK